MVTIFTDWLGLLVRENNVSTTVLGMRFCTIKIHNAAPKSNLVVEGEEHGEVE